MEQTSRGISKFFDKGIIFLLFCISVCAIYISYTKGIILAYNDATAHLNTARRIVDSLTPGIVQIGSVWLPLLHLLELPFAANFFLWQSGLAGSIVSGISFILGGFFLYKLITYLCKDRLAAVLGILVYASNVNFLYLQTTPMFEPLLICTALGAVYYLTRWSIENNYLYLILAAFFTMLATLTRYDGWALFLAMSGFVFIRSILRKKSWDGPLLVFLLLAGFGIGMWLLYNYLIFSDPLYFSRGEFSAAAQQQVLYSRGQLATKHDLPLSFVTYSLSTIFNIGIVMTVVGILGAIVYFITNFFSLKKYPPLLLFTPFAFNIVSLYLGQSVIWLPMIKPYFNAFFNARYGILMLPAMACFAGYLASRHVLFKLLIGVCCIIQLVLFLEPQLLPLFGKQIGIITLQDTVSSVNQQTRSASTFLHSHYSGGLIMVSSASSDAFIFRTGIPLKNFITEGTGKYWKESLDNPGKYATWIVFFKDHSDRVGKKVPTFSYFTHQFYLAYQDQTYQIWKKNGQ